jgi:hypothetical protein
MHIQVYVNKLCEWYDVASKDNEFIFIEKHPNIAKLTQESEMTCGPLVNYFSYMLNIFPSK